MGDEGDKKKKNNEERNVAFWILFLDVDSKKIRSIAIVMVPFSFFLFSFCLYFFFVFFFLLLFAEIYYFNTDGLFVFFALLWFIACVCVLFFLVFYCLWSWFLCWTFAVIIQHLKRTHFAVDYFKIHLNFALFFFFLTSTKGKIKKITTNEKKCRLLPFSSNLLRFRISCWICFQSNISPI